MGSRPDVWITVSCTTCQKRNWVHFGDFSDPEQKPIEAFTCFGCSTTQWIDDSEGEECQHDLADAVVAPGLENPHPIDPRE